MPGADVTLVGTNFEAQNVASGNLAERVSTGAFLPFGTPSEQGQVIEGDVKCSGSVLRCNPDGSDLELVAWGLRNPYGKAFHPDGRLFVTEHDIDERGHRYIVGDHEDFYEIREGAWYGWPDFSAALEPLTDPKFDVPDSLQAPVYVGDELQEKELGFVIDHEASGLEPPDPSLVLGLHEYQSSPTKLDVAPDSWGELAGQVFVAEWGDLAPETNPFQDERPGYRVVRIDPATGQVEPFVFNAQPGPASEQEALGAGIERPFDVKFGPDGAMYVVDYGVARVNQARTAEGQVPYEFPPETGAIWRITPPDGAATTVDAEGAATETVIEDILTPAATP